MDLNMTAELTNLLPQGQVKALKRDYFLRLATVSLLMCSGIVLVGAILLLPSYIYERETTDQETAELARLSTNLATSAEQQVQGEISTLDTKTQAITALSSSATASTALRAAPAPRPGISLNGFTFTPPAKGTPGIMEISGVSDTREDLRSYDTALAALPFVTNADLPISDYAQASNIPFTITLTGSLKP
jgi:Tfp pilus assembly protein PilN